jgi:hypothetical protein
MQIVGRGADNSLWTGSFAADGSFNNDWTQIPGQTALSSPAIAWNPVAKTMQIVIRSSDNSIADATFAANGTFNNDWRKGRIRTLSSPVIAWNETLKQMQLILVEVDGSLRTNLFTSSRLLLNKNWVTVPVSTETGPLHGPALVWNPTSQTMQVLAIDANNSVWAGAFSAAGVFNKNWVLVPGTPGKAVESLTAAWDAVALETAIIARMTPAAGSANGPLWFSSINAAGAFNNNWTSLSQDSASTPSVAWHPASLNLLQVVAEGTDGFPWTMFY